MRVIRQGLLPDSIIRWNTQVVGGTRVLHNSPMQLTEYFLQLVAGYWFKAVIKVRLTIDRFPVLLIISSDWQYLFHNHIINRMLLLVSSQYSK